MCNLLGLIDKFDLTNYTQKSRSFDGVFLTTEKLGEFKNIMLAN